MERSTARLCGALALLLSGCGPAPDDDDGTEASEAAVPRVEDLWEVIPGEGLPPEVEDQDANNNLDIARFEDRLFLAFRTAPTHFASEGTVMYVVSTVDEESWRWEGTFALGTDVREPQLVPWKGELHLFFAVLGTNPLDFEPQGTRHTVYRGTGDWDPLEEFGDSTLIPWRIKEVSGKLYMTAYTGGENVYEPDGEPIEVQWLTSEDAVVWDPVVSGQPVVLRGGGSETDFAFTKDGGIVAVVRNEAGDDDGFGSKVCTAPPGDLGTWTCASDPRKYDSPLIIDDEGEIWLVARRNVTETGHYDLGLEGERSERYLQYQANYWGQPKRCSVWRVSAEDRKVEWALDLASRGDTCFPEALPDGDGWLLYNYSSPIDGPDPSWLEGQNGLTHIYRQRLILK